MLLLNQSPPSPASDMAKYYARMANHGMVHSTLMHGERYDPADDFDDTWRCSAITWSVDGEEEYNFLDGRSVLVKSAGALVLAAGERYGYYARAPYPFFSNMIVFPHWLTKDASPLTTRRILPDEALQSRLNLVATNCRNNNNDIGWFEEQMTLLFETLQENQRSEDDSKTQMSSAKETTRDMLAEKLARAKNHILENYERPALSLNDIARNACLSPFHLIRTFKEIYGITPMQFLITARLAAAQHLLHGTDRTVSNIAAAVGYADRISFYRAFKKRLGISPTDLRKTIL